MATVTTVVVWGADHDVTTDGKPMGAASVILHNYLRQQHAAGKLTNEVGNFGNVELPDSSGTITQNVTHEWADEASALAYLNFISNLSPTSATIV